MSHSNSHHRTLRGRPPPEDLPQRERGQRRPRSPEAPPQPGTPPRNPLEPTLITKSPHSRRTIKKGKLDGDNQPVPHPTSHKHTSIESLQTDDPSTDPATSTKPTPTATLPEAPSPVQTLLEHLTTQLETVLRTVDTLLHNNLDIAHLDTSHTIQVLRQLNKRLDTGATTVTQTLASPRQNSDRTRSPTPKKTYAEATSTMKRPAGPPRTHHNKTGTKSIPLPSRKSDFGRLIVEFGEDTVHQLPPDKIKDNLNDLFASYGNNGTAARIAGARFSRKKNLVLAVIPAVSTKDILSSDLTSAMISCLRDCLDLSETSAQMTRIYPADPWHRVVINNIPLRDVQQGPEGSWFEQNSKSIISDWEEFNPLARSVAVHCKTSSRYLVPKTTPPENLRAKGSVSMCIAFDNVKYARRLIQEGAFIHGTHCRVSSYRPMTRPRD